MLISNVKIVAAALALIITVAASRVVTVQALASEPPVADKTSYTEDLSRLSKDAAQRYAAIKPRPDELKFRQIPWLTDLNKGIQVAKEEKRPLLIWTGQQSHPLERC